MIRYAGSSNPTGIRVFINQHKRLALNDKHIIQYALEDRNSFKVIASLLGKDCTIISLEIENHMISEEKKAPTDRSMITFTGNTALLKPPYVCNGCPYKRSYTLEKHLYDAHKVHSEYQLVRSESRSGFNLI